MDKSYLPTFTSTQTSTQYAETRFQLARSDEQRMEFFKKYPTYWKAFEEELRTLIEEEWEGWTVDRPGWLTEEIIENIPARLMFNVNGGANVRINGERSGGPRVGKAKGADKAGGNSGRKKRNSVVEILGLNGTMKPPKAGMEGSDSEGSGSFDYEDVREMAP